MLTASQFDALMVPITDLYEEYNLSVIEDIARRLMNMDMTATAAWEVQRLTESGMLYSDILEILSTLTGKTTEVLAESFRQAGVKAIAFDDSIYLAAGLNPLPINLSPAMTQVLLAGLEKTKAVMFNLTMTTAETGQDAFIEAADLAYQQVSSGAMSYTQAIKVAIKSVARQGLKMIEYSGSRDQVDVAVRRTVLTGVAQTTGVLQETRAEEMGSDLVQTSAHIGARPAHQLWQGRIFSRSGTDKSYPNFRTATGYGTGPGLCGWNCRHSFYPFFAGISENAYEQATIDEYADMMVDYNGQEISMYDATQVQRKYEREIRALKREAAGLGAAGIDNGEELGEVRDLQAKLRDFVVQTKLLRQPEREGSRVLRVRQVDQVEAVQ